MHSIFLNTWYAKCGDRFYDFVVQSSSNTDIFCFTEVDPDLFSKLEAKLPGFKGFYEKGIFDKKMGVFYGHAIFTKRDIQTRAFEKIISFRWVNNDIVFILPYGLKIGEKDLYLMNVHGKAMPGHKLDTPARIRQSRNIIDFLKGKNGPKIIGGDFNLDFHTKSVKMFEDAGYRNLIKEYGIKDTRGEVNHRQYTSSEQQYFSDYCFVSQDVKVKDFKVPDIGISDHLPLILDFEV